MSLRLLDLILEQHFKMIKKNNLFVIILYLFLHQYSYANDNIYYIDLDFLLKNSNFGKKIIKDINDYEAEISEELKSKEKIIIKNDNEIKKTKNLISAEAFNEKLELLQESIKIFNEEKKKNIDSYNKLRTEKINNFYSQINPLIQKYMSDKSIIILLEKKNIFIASSEYEITSQILDIINNEIK